MNTPKSVDISITNDCNLRCKYCSHFSSAQEAERELETAEWLKFFKELNECAVLDVCLSGGEPFIRKDIKELIEGIVKNKMRYGLLSNGSFITEDIASFIKSTGRCTSIQISIDGASAEIHDASRGKGAFYKALKGIEYIRKYNINTTVRVTINKYNVHNLNEIATMLLEDLKLGGFGTNSAGYMGLCRDNQDVQLSIEERMVAMETLLKLNIKYNNRINATAGPLAEARSWLEMEEARKNGKESMPNRGCLTGCGGFFSKIAVRADGVYVPCIQMAHIELGRINQDSLRDVWKKNEELNKLRDRREISLTEFEFCKDCEYVKYCTGNCPALSYTYVSDEYHPSPDACLRRFLEAGGRLPDINQSLGST